MSSSPYGEFVGPAIEDGGMGNNVIQDDANGNHHHYSSSVVPTDLGDDTKLNLTELEEENMHLKSRLLAIRMQREKLRDIREKTAHAEASLERLINNSRHEQNEAFNDLQSAIADRTFKEHQLSNMRKWMPLNDCFFIGTQGTFGTINGLRLGAEAVVENFDNMRLLPATSGGAKSGADHQRTSNGRRNVSSNDLSRGVNGGEGLVPDVVSMKVPWSEINSALGQLALLLSIIESTPNGGIHYRHEILCCGSTSKVGIRRNGSSSVAYYNLFSDDSFQFFGRRNFNTALQSLLQCVLDAAEQIRDKDPTITLPHPIEQVAARGELTVGGLTVAYGTDGVAWTRAMKYLLTDVKHLLLFRPLALWGSTQESSTSQSTTSS